MKLLSFILAFVLANNITVLRAQEITDNNGNKFSIQVDFGVARTLHYNSPVVLTECIEGCFVDNQFSRTAYDMNLSFYNRLNLKNSIKLGVGSSTYNYIEKGQGDVGNGTLAPYQVNSSWDFFSVFTGFRHMLNPTDKLNFFIESDLIYDIPLQDYNLVKAGFSIQPKIGAMFNLGSKWSLLTQGFFKSAISSYSKENATEAYRPYAYGVQLGLHLKM